MTFHWKTDLIHQETGKAYRALVKDTAGEVVLFHSVESLEKRDDSWSPWDSDGGGCVWATLPHTPFTEESKKALCAEMWKYTKIEHQDWMDNLLERKTREYTEFQKTAIDALDRLHPGNPNVGNKSACIYLDTPIDDKNKALLLSYFPDDAVVLFFNSDEVEYDDEWEQEEILAEKYFENAFE